MQFPACEVQCGGGGAERSSNDGRRRGSWEEEPHHTVHVQYYHLCKVIFLSFWTYSIKISKLIAWYFSLYLVYWKFLWFYFCARVCRNAIILTSITQWNFKLFISLNQDWNFLYQCHIFQNYFSFKCFFFFSFLSAESRRALWTCPWWSSVAVRIPSSIWCQSSSPPSRPLRWLCSSPSDLMLTGLFLSLVNF